MLKNEELLAALHSGDEAQKNRAFILIWESRDFRSMAFSKWKLDKQREDEVWQDAIVALNKAFLYGGFRGDAKISSYLYKTVQNLCNTAENKKKPLSDQKLTKSLLDKGYNIARRTVAKYREQLNIPVARLRKQI